MPFHYVIVLQGCDNYRAGPYAIYAAAVFSSRQVMSVCPIRFMMVSPRQPSGSHLVMVVIVVMSEAVHKMSEARG